MSGHQPTRRTVSPGQSLGINLRLLREQSGEPGWRVAGAAEMDSTLLSKIENSKRLPTQNQLAALAAFFKVPLADLSALRIAEEMTKRYGNTAEFAAAAAIVQERSGEYRVKVVPVPANNRAQSVNRRGKSK